MPDPKDTPSSPRQVLQAPRFAKSKRRLPPVAQLKVDEAVRGLLAYQFDEKRDLIEVLDVGPHENFYRDLQKYLDAR